MGCFSCLFSCFFEKEQQNSDIMNPLQCESIESHETIDRNIGHYYNNDEPIRISSQKKVRFSNVNYD
jgi:hypothetical protein